MNWSRLVTIIIVAAGVLAAVVYGFWPRPVPVTTAKVDRGTLRVTVEEEGRTRVADRYVVSAPVSGFARRIDLKVGDGVKKGGVLTRIEPSRPVALDPRSRDEAVSKVAAAEAALKAAQERARASEADAVYSASELERVKGLFNEGYASKDMLEAAEADAGRLSASKRSAGFDVDVARYELDAAKAALKFYSRESEAGSGDVMSVRSPVDGSVLKVIHESEGSVASGEPLLEVGDPAALEVEVDLLSSDAVRVSPGTSVRFERWGGDEPLEGRVRIIEPAGFTKISALGVEEQRVLVISDFTSKPEKWARLGDGYRVEASFTLWDGENILKAPSSALFRYADGWAAFVVEGGRAKRRTVEVGHKSGLTAEILSGLAEGDVVITHPNDAIEDDTRVRLR